MSPRVQIGLSAVFASLAVAGYLETVVSIPIGPWSGMYAPFWPVWMFLGGALGGLLVIIQRKNVEWAPVVLVAVLAVLLVTNLSRLWGVPFGIRDPFHHLFLVRTDTYRFGQNAYPLMHLLTRALVSTTGLSVTTALGAIPLVSTTLGVGFLALSLRRLSLSRRVQQTAVVAGIPTIFAGFIARPYTLAVPFILVFVWVVTTGIRRRSIQVLLVVLTFGSLWLHPISLLVGGGVVVTAIVVATAFDRYPIGGIESPPAGWWCRSPFVALILGALFVHLVALAGIGGPVIDRAADEAAAMFPRELSSLLGETSSAAGTSDSTAGATQSGGTSPDSGGGTSASSTSSTSSSGAKSGPPPLIVQLWGKFGEFLRRASLGLTLLLGAVLLAIREFRTRAVHYLTTVVGVTGIGILAFFVAIDLLQVPVFSGRRILAFAPLLVFPVFARLLDGVGNRARILMAVFVLTSGLGVAYASPAITGGVQHGATTAQVEGYRWYHDHGTTPLVTSGSTFWIAQGLFGPDVVLKWADGRWGPNVWMHRDARHPWQVADRPGSSVVISDLERTQARYRARETGDYGPFVELRRFQATTDRYYDNGNLRFYRPASRS